MKFRTFLLLAIGNCLIISLSAQNPLTPPGIYFADPSAHVWNNSLFLYGSLDERCDYWCSWKHHVIETKDMKKWKIHEDVFASKGKNDEVSYNDQLLFAPDCAFKNDTFYLYYCQPDNVSAEGVATASKPEGPFTKGQKLNVNYQQIDPSLFIDDDGEAYYIWGQFSLKMAKMKDNMRELDMSTFKDSIITEKDHHFHEGAFMAKRNGIYYIVFADISRSEMPTCLGYATSKNPFGPYKYGGVIIDNDHCNPGNWNNHGSIAEFNNQWYVFYHRSTHGCDKMRQPCAEPIYFMEDGSIPEVEMTSQGPNGPLDATKRIEAEQSCILSGNIRVQAFSKDQEELGQIRSGDKAIYKYIDFGKGTDKITIRVRSGAKGGKISLAADKPWHNQFAEIKIEPDGNGEWQTLTFSTSKLSGVHELYLSFSGDGDNLISLDWFRFN